LNVLTRVLVVPGDDSCEPPKELVKGEP
jgi:hypothetical protein